MFAVASSAPSSSSSLGQSIICFIIILHVGGATHQQMGGTIQHNLKDENANVQDDAKKTVVGVAVDQDGMPPPPHQDDGGGQASEVGICYGDDIYQNDIITDGWLTAAYGLSPPVLSRNTRDRHTRHRSQTLQKRATIYPQETAQRQNQVFTSKKVQRMRMRRDVNFNQVRAARMRRAAIALRNRLWPDRTIPYEIDSYFVNSTRDTLIQSMRHWEQYTCLRFVPHTNQTGYVRFISSDGCCSYVGYTGKEQLISIGPGCEYLGTMVHEIGHVIGFWHEQSRPDRDNHVTVIDDNVADLVLHNFVKHDHRVINSLGQPYDYESIMHYGSRSFSKNFQKTIIVKDGENEIGQRRVLSVGDILQANLLYRCSSTVFECGGAIFQSDGHISSPRYPASIVANTTCDWSIGVEEGFGVKLEFSDLDLPADEDGECHRSYVELRDGLGELSPLIGRYCGHSLPNPVTIDSGNIWIRFVSGPRRHLDMAGFSARFESVSLHKTLTAPSGILKSINYPLSFPPETDAVWLITQRDGFIVTLRIDELLIPRSSTTGCLSDYLTIFDGPSSQSRMITKLCISQSRVGVASSGPNLRIQMHSGPPSLPKELIFEHKPTRFLARYSARDVNECRVNNGGCEQACLNMFGGHVCGCQHGYTVDANYKNCTDVNECETMENGAGCSHMCVNTEGGYHCACPEGFYLSTQNKTHCIDENECDDPTRNGCQQHCHNTLGGYACSCAPGYILDTDNKHCIELQSCGGFLNDYEGSLLSPVLPEHNNHSLDCVWQISVDEDLSISLRFFFDFWSSNAYCHSYMDVTEGRRVPTEEHFRICDNDDIIDVYDTASDLIWVHYHAESNHEGIFQVDYSTQVKDNRTVECGGQLNGTGTLETPGYPNVYPNSVNCMWRITGRSLVKFVFENFDLEKEEQCQYDFLDIRDGHQEEPTSRHIGRFCGNVTPPAELESSTGELYIMFQSDATVQGGGFRAAFEIEQL